MPTKQGGGNVGIESGITVRPGFRWQLSMNPNYVRETDSQ